MIKLSSIVKIQNINDYKIHIAKNNGVTNPLDAYLESFDNWIEWNEYTPKGKGRYGNSKFVFSVMDFYPQPGYYLFGGIFEIEDKHDDYYDINLCNDYSEFIGRLKLKIDYSARNNVIELSNLYESIEVVEVLPEKYNVITFPGYDNINLHYSVINRIINKKNIDWKIPLESIYGVYMLTDTSSGKRYIGSAYGEGGIWSRWSEYCQNGHGNNQKLVKLIEEKGFEYFKNNFKFTLLQAFVKNTDKEVVILRESYWKEVMMSREDNFGYNDN